MRIDSERFSKDSQFFLLIFLVAHHKKKIENLLFWEFFENRFRRQKKVNFQKNDFIKKSYINDWLSQSIVNFCSMETMGIYSLFSHNNIFLIQLCALMPLRVFHFQIVANNRSYSSDSFRSNVRKFFYTFSFFCFKNCNDEKYLLQIQTLHVRDSIHLLVKNCVKYWTSKFFKVTHILLFLAKFCPLFPKPICTYPKRGRSLCMLPKVINKKFHLKNSSMEEHLQCNLRFLFGWPKKCVLSKKFFERWSFV